MRKTALYDVHVSREARMEEYGGFLMPIQFSKIQDEHMAVRTSAGLFDVSHMGEFLVEGKGAVPFLEKMTTNKVSALKVGQAQYTLMANEKGGIIDDLVLYRLEENRFMMVVNAANTAKDWDWLIENKSFDVITENKSSEMGLLALQGPKAKNILARLTATDLETISFYHCRYGEVAGIDSVLISATGYTGSGGFELYVPDDRLVDLWEALREAGRSEDLTPAGLGARDTLRLEMGYPLYGQDIDEKTSPFEAGLGWVVKLKKTAFIGKEQLTKQKSKDLVETLKGFTLRKKRVPRTGHIIYDLHKKVIGRVTSGTFSPCLQKSIGMGYIRTSQMTEGMEILVFDGKKFLEGYLTETPFVNVEDYVS